MKVNIIFSLFLILLFAVILFGCKNNDSKPSILVVNESDQVKSNEQTSTNVKSADNIREFTIHGSSFKFDPVNIKVKKGEKIKITYSSDDIGHNLVIDELSVRTNIISKGQTEVVEFIADKVGNFPIYCSVGNHRALGMEGLIVVES